MAKNNMDDAVVQKFLGRGHTHINNSQPPKQTSMLAYVPNVPNVKDPEINGAKSGAFDDATRPGKTVLGAVSPNTRKRRGDEGPELVHDPKKGCVGVIGLAAVGTGGGDHRNGNEKEKERVREKERQKKEKDKERMRMEKERERKEKEKEREALEKLEKQREKNEDGESPHTARLSQVLQRLLILERIDKNSGETNRKVDDLAEGIKRTDVKVEHIEERVEVVEEKAEVLEEKVQTMEEKVQMMGEKVDNSSSRVDKIDTRAEQQAIEMREMAKQINQLTSGHRPNKWVEFQNLRSEAHSRGCSLVIEGITDEDGETRQKMADKIYSFWDAELGVDDVGIDYAQREGRFRQQSKRPITVYFYSMNDRNLILRGRQTLIKNRRPFFIKENWPKKLNDLHSVMRKVKQVVTKREGPEKVYIREFTLLYCGVAYHALDLEALPRDYRPSMMWSPRNAQVCVFFTKNCPLSNHYQCFFEVDDITFNCVEQFLAYKRAEMADDLDQAAAALRAWDPPEHKGILGKFHGHMTDATWVEARPKLLENALWAKFSQVEVLGDFLVDTGIRKLGEASTSSTDWSIGLHVFDSKAMNHSNWVGGNLLGITLEKVRERLSIQRNENLENQMEY